MLKQIIIVLTLIIPMTAGCSDNPDPRGVERDIPAEQSGKSAAKQSEKSAAGQQDSFIEVDEFPEPVHQAMPKYPESAKKEKREATVLVSALVGTDGSVKQVKVMKSENGSPDFESSAVDAAKQWKFKPATKQKKPVEIWVTIPFRFKLDGAKK